MFLLQPLSNLSHRLGGEGDILLRSLEKGRMREMGCSGGVAGMVEGRDEKKLGWYFRGRFGGDRIRQRGELSWVNKLEVTAPQVQL